MSRCHRVGIGGVGVFFLYFFHFCFLLLRSFNMCNSFTHLFIYLFISNKIHIFIYIDIN